jgi:hypothetical protein
MYRYQRHGLGIMRSFSGLHGYVAVATVLPLLRLPPTFHGFESIIDHKCADTAHSIIMPVTIG